MKTRQGNHVFWKSQHSQKFVAPEHYHIHNNFQPGFLLERWVSISAQTKPRYKLTRYIGTIWYRILWLGPMRIPSFPLSSTTWHVKNLHSESFRLMRVGASTHESTLPSCPQVAFFIITISPSLQKTRRTQWNYMSVMQDILSYSQERISMIDLQEHLEFCRITWYSYFVSPVAKIYLILSTTYDLQHFGPLTVSGPNDNHSIVHTGRSYLSAANLWKIRHRKLLKRNANEEPKELNLMLVKTRFIISL